MSGGNMEDEKLLVNRAEEFLQLFKKGAEFTQELLKDNERLRYRVLELEQPILRPVTPPLGGVTGNSQLLARVQELEHEKELILARIRQVEEENHDFAQRYLEVELENNNLASLYIASYQLHSTLDFQEVLQIIVEIVINLIGAEEFAILLLDDRASMLQPAAAEGLDLQTLPRIAIGDGIVGKAVQTGESYFVEQFDANGGDLQHPLVCIPLKIKDDPIGVLVISKLLVQKTSFAPVDYELFTMLAAHAATAIFASRLYTASERKLTTIQGFLDLLTRKV
jgi:transcriptional regulator with GAF, ATPase, and Fis domain